MPKHIQVPDEDEKAEIRLQLTRRSRSSSQIDRQALRSCLCAGGCINGSLRSSCDVRPCIVIQGWQC